MSIYIVTSKVIFKQKLPNDVMMQLAQRRISEMDGSKFSEDDLEFIKADLIDLTAEMEYAVAFRSEVAAGSIVDAHNAFCNEMYEGLRSLKEFKDYDIISVELKQ